MKIVDGNKIAQKIFSELKIEVAGLQEKGLEVKLAVFLVGENPASLSYIQLKKKRAEEIGIIVELNKFPLDISQEDLESEIKSAAQRDDVSGILIQLPLPGHLDKEKILDAVPVDLDVDSLSGLNKQAVIEGRGIKFYPPAAQAVLAILDKHKVDLTAHVVIVGTGDLIGRPLSALLLARGVDFELINRYTENYRELLQKADVIITGVGKANLISGDLLKEGVVVIDAGTTGSEDGDVTGDVDRESVVRKASLLSPVPGGVGPVTIAMLLKNVVEAAKRKH